MTERMPGVSSELKKLVDTATLEVFPSGKVAESLRGVSPLTHISVSASPTQGIDPTIELTTSLRKEGLNATPHLAARSIRNFEHLKEILNTLEETKVQEVFVVAGDNTTASGDYTSAISLIKDIVKINPNLKKIGVTGYPSGHNFIPNDVLFDSLKEKDKFAKENDLDMYVVSQMCFEPEKIAKWLYEIRARGIKMPVIIGIPGAIDALKLIKFAAKSGISDSLKVLESRIGADLIKNTMLGYTPDELIAGLPLYDQTLNIAGFYIFTFNSVTKTRDWKKQLL